MMMTRIHGYVCLIRRVASNPSSPGIRRSMRTTSGRTLAATSIASRPLAATPTTWTPSSSRNCCNKATVSRPSSTSRTRGRVFWVPVGIDRPQLVMVIECIGSPAPRPDWSPAVPALWLVHSAHRLADSGGTRRGRGGGPKGDRLGDEEIYARTWEAWERRNARHIGLGPLEAGPIPRKSGFLCPTGPFLAGVQRPLREVLSSFGGPAYAVLTPGVDITRLATRRGRVRGVQPAFFAGA